MVLIESVKEYLSEHLFSKENDAEKDELVLEQVDFDEWMRIMLS